MPLRDDLLDGNTLARISDRVNAVFNKMKINSTSQMAGTAFRLRFVLKRFTGSAFETVPGMCAHSHARTHARTCIARAHARTCIARISDRVNAVFNKMKINSTSQMVGTNIHRF